MLDMKMVEAAIVVQVLIIGALINVDDWNTDSSRCRRCTEGNYCREIMAMNVIKNSIMAVV